MAGALALHLLGELAQDRNLVLHPLVHRQPAETVGDDLFVLGVVAPQRGVAFPHTTGGVIGSRPLHRLPDLPGNGPETGMTALHPDGTDPARCLDPLGQAVQQLLEVGGEAVDTVVLQLGRHRGQVDAELVKAGEMGQRLLDRRRQCGSDAPVVAEGVDGRLRHGVDGVGADEVLDVQDVRQPRVLGRRRRPQAALDARPLLLEAREAARGEDAEEALVGVLGVGDAHRAEEIEATGLLELGVAHLVDA